MRRAGFLLEARLATSRQASSSCVHVLVRQGLIPPITADQFTYRLKRLARSFRARRHDIEELEQELLVVLVRALNRYQPGRMSLGAFLKAALNGGYCDMCRRMKTECRRRARRAPLSDEVPVRNRSEPPDPEALQLAWDSLGDNERELAHQLGVMTPAQVARMRDLHRGTVLREAAKLRTKFQGVNA
jgi:RNA polymerase sigma factor (sigma-70 family)